MSYTSSFTTDKFQLMPYGFGQQGQPIQISPQPELLLPPPIPIPIQTIDLQNPFQQLEFQPMKDVIRQVATSKAWNENQIQLINQVVVSGVLSSSADLVEKVNALANCKTQEHTFSAVARKCNSIRRELNLSTGIVVEQRPQAATPNQITAPHESMQPPPILTREKVSQIKVADLLNPVQEPMTGYFQWSPIQQEFLVQHARSGEHLTKKELCKKVNDLATGEREIHTEDAIRNQFYRVRRNFGISSKNPSNRVWNDKQIDLMVQVAQTEESISSQKLMIRVNALADHETQKHALKDVDAKRSEFSELSSNVMKLPIPPSAPDERMQISELQNPFQEDKQRSHKKNVKWTSEQNELLTRYILSGEESGRIELDSQINDLAKEDSLKHSQKAITCHLSEMRKKLGKEKASIRWNDQQINLITERVKLGIIPDSQKLTDEVNSLANNNRRKHSVKSVTKKCYIIRRAFGIHVLPKS